MDRGTQNRDLNDQNGSTVEAKRPPKGPVAIATSMTEDFVKTLLQTPEIAKGRRPGAIKKAVQRVITWTLLPLPKKGRKKLERITIGWKLYRAQIEEKKKGLRSQIDWVGIINQADPEISKIKSERRRKRSFNRSKNSILQRERREAERRGRPRARAKQKPAVKP